MAAATSTRWCPTPEQLMILEEMYRSGVRTPNATQIQKITAHLSLYGKIEGKNVFYWFQNHKARDRQKLRRKLKQFQLQQQQLFHHPQMQQNYHPIFHYLESPIYHPAFSFYNPNTKFLPQVEVLDQDGQKEVMNYTWNLDIPESVGIMDKSMMRMYGSDWMMMVNVETPLSPCCKSSPLKTLDLFPITASNLREECKLQAPDQPNPCSV